MSSPKVITWDYQFAPNAQKARNLLHAAGIPYEICEQPFMQPRPVMRSLGITYRRVPVNSIGKDFYFDNRIFLSAVQNIFKDKALPTTPADHAYESFGYRSFWIALPLVDPKLITPEMAKEREDLFTVFSRPDFADLRPSALAEFRSLLDMVENDFLAENDGGPWIGGKRCGIADIHAIWIIKWAFQTLDVAQEPGFSKQDFPKVYRWFEGLPPHTPEAEKPKIEATKATEQVLKAEYAAPDIGFDENDPTGFRHGQSVSVETNDDAKPGNTPQHGKLIGLGRHEIVIELDNGLRLHFPRIGFVLRKVDG